MSSLRQIEEAIERLSPADVNLLAPWLDEYQQMIHASAATFSLYDVDQAKGGES